MQYKLLNYVHQGAPRAGILLENDTVVDAAALLGNRVDPTVEGLLEQWDSLRGRLADQVRTRTPGVQALPLTQLKLTAPILRGQVFIAGSNYRDHIQEMLQRDLAGGMKREAVHLQRPYHALKGSRACLVGPDAQVRTPLGCQKFDWEAELAVVLGRHANNVPVERALDYVAGYTISNDLSARDLGRRADAEKGTTFWVDWIGHKSFDGAAPLGPWITVSEDIPDPQSLSIKLWVNEQLRQDSNTSNMIFSVAEQIAYLSSRIPLFPGDVILTGTPAGTATSHGGCYLKTGDVVRIQIEHLGELVTHIA